MNDSIEVPDDLIRKVSADVMEHLQSSLGRLPTEREVLQATTSLMLRVGMMAEIRASAAGVNQEEIMRTTLEAAKEWRSRHSIQYTARPIN